MLRQDIDWNALPSDTPLRLRRLLERCLDRDPRTRLRDVGEARVEIAKVESGAPHTSLAAAPPPRRWREAMAYGVAGLGVLTAIAIGYIRQPGATERGRVVGLPFVAPDSVVTEIGNATISPDGQKLVISGRSPDGRRILWVRSLDSMDAMPLPDTDDAIEPFWSPDSRSIAFGAQGKLKRIDLGGTRAQPLAEGARSNNGAWSPSGVFVFSPDYRSPLFRVPAGGGDRSRVTTIDTARGESGHRFPAFLPDGRHFLYSWNRPGASAVMVGSVDSTDTRMVLPEFGPAVYAPPGGCCTSGTGRSWRRRSMRTGSN